MLTVSAAVPAWLVLLASWTAATTFATPLNFNLFISDGHGLSTVELRFFRADAAGTSPGDSGHQQTTFPGVSAGGANPSVPMYGISDPPVGGGQNNQFAAPPGSNEQQGSSLSQPDGGFNRGAASRPSQGGVGPVWTGPYGPAFVGEPPKGISGANFVSSSHIARGKFG